MGEIGKRLVFSRCKIYHIHQNTNRRHLVCIGCDAYRIDPNTSSGISDRTSFVHALWWGPEKLPTWCVKDKGPQLTLEATVVGYDRYEIRRQTVLKDLKILPPPAYRGVPYAQH